MEYKSILVHIHRPTMTAKFDFRKEVALPKRQVHRTKNIPYFKVKLPSFKVLVKSVGSSSKPIGSTFDFVNRKMTINNPFFLF